MDQKKRTIGARRKIKIMGFYITLISNDPNAIKFNYHNTLSDFTSILPNPLSFQGDWRVSLHSFFCHNQFKDDEGDYLKIYCDIINPLYGQDNCIAVVARPKEHGIHPPKRVFFEPLVREYFKVNRTNVNEIGIKVHAAGDSLAEDTCGIKLLAGQPTVCVLHFEEHTMGSPEYTLRLNSHKSYNKAFDDNTASDFRCQLGSYFNFNPLEGEKEVAVSSITYQPYFNLDSEPQYLRVINPKPPWNPHWHKAIPEFRGSNLDDYIDYLADDVFGDDVTNAFKTRNQKFEVFVERTDADEDNEKERLQIYTSRYCILEIPYSLLFNMGERTFKVNKNILGYSGVTKHEGNYLRLSLSPSKKYVFEAAPDPYAYYPDMGFLYCDFVTYSCIGNVSAPLLKSFPIKHRENKQNYVTYWAQSKDYYPISKFDLSTVGFSIKDVTGAPMPFMNKDSNVIINLLIRPRNKAYDSMYY